MAHDVFVCYSSKDKPYADALVAKFEAQGIRCWIAPRDIVAGADWGEAILDALEGSRLLLLVWTGNANESSQVKREVERAVHHGCTVVPVRIEDVKPSRSLEYSLATVHWLDVLTPPLERHLDSITSALRRHLQAEEPAGESEPVPVPTPVRKPKRWVYALLGLALAAIGVFVAPGLGVGRKPEPGVRAPDGSTESGEEAADRPAAAAGGVFVSHANADAAAATQVAEMLEAAGIPCWLASRDLGASADLQQEIRRAIESRPVCLVLLSYAANESRWMGEEIKIARSTGKAVLPLRIEPVSAGDALSPLLMYQWLDVSQGSLQDHERRIVETVRGLSTESSK